jgi:hypothetical protein
LNLRILKKAWIMSLFQNRMVLGSAFLKKAGKNETFGAKIFIQADAPVLAALSYHAGSSAGYPHLQVRAHVRGANRL